MYGNGPENYEPKCRWPLKVRTWKMLLDIRFFRALNILIDIINFCVGSIHNLANRVIGDFPMVVTKELLNGK